MTWRTFRWSSAAISYLGGEAQRTFLQGALVTILRRPSSPRSGFVFPLLRSVQVRERVGLALERSEVEGGAGTPEE